MEIVKTGRWYENIAILGDTNLYFLYLEGNKHLTLRVLDNEIKGGGVFIGPDDEKIISRPIPGHIIPVESKKAVKFNRFIIKHLFTD